MELGFAEQLETRSFRDRVAPAGLGVRTTLIVETQPGCSDSAS